MPNTKVVFIGNPLCGDDGIGPHLYNELKSHFKLKDYELLELGVIGFDLISYVEKNDKLIIVDAVHSKKESEIGKVVLLDENDLSKDISLVSQHDFGVEQTAKILRTYEPNLENISIVGISVRRFKSFSTELSEEILKNLPQIKKDVVNYILKIAKSG